jgi:hypothetical protein
MAKVKSEKSYAQKSLPKKRDLRDCNAECGRFEPSGTITPNQRDPAEVLGNESLESAGINRQEAENERFSRERSSDPLGPEFCAGRREAHSEA